MTTVNAKQNTFQAALHGFVNAGVGRRDLPRVLLHPGALRRARASALVRDYEALSDAQPRSGSEVTVRAAPYAGQNAHVRRMMTFLDRHLGDALYGAYVHGSLGSGEEVPYSDFDALVILNHRAFDGPERLAETARALRKARAIMFDYDPLQHHGWFVLTEADLVSYCEAYFPSALFAYAKALTPGRGEHLTLSVRDSSEELREAFRSLAGGVSRQLAGGAFPRDLYNLKSLLSKFMLLPAMYVQVRDGVGVWKADSFEQARRDFDAADWASMAAVSEIRATWSYRLPRLQRRLMASAQPWRREVIRRWPAPVPPPIAAQLTPQLHASMMRLTELMEERLEVQRAIV